MRIVVYNGAEVTLHPEAGILVPGPNEVYDDALAERILRAGRVSGEYSEPVRLHAKPEGTDGAERFETPHPRGRKGKE